MLPDRARRRLSGYAAAASAASATIGHGVACRAVACEASEGWWSQAGSNRRPRHCERRALPAELWPRCGRLENRNRRPTIAAIYSPRLCQVKNGEIDVSRPILPGTSLVCEGGNRYLEHDPEKWLPVFRKRSCSNKRSRAG